MSFKFANGNDLRGVPAQLTPHRSLSMSSPQIQIQTQGNPGHGARNIASIRNTKNGTRHGPRTEEINVILCLYF